MLLEEFSPVFKYIKGKDNVIADTLSRLPLQQDTPEKKKEFFGPDPTDDSDLETAIDSPDSDSDLLSLSELFLNYPEDIPMYPLAFDQLTQDQAANVDISTNPRYTTENFNGTDLTPANSWVSMECSSP